MEYPDVIIRHRENRRKCSLTPLAGRVDLLFLNDPDLGRYAETGTRPPFADCLFLHVDGPPLGPADAGRKLLLLDASWRRALALSLHPALAGLEKRSLSGFQTAYPRASRIFPGPNAGLASVEALYAARLQQGREDLTLLDGYYWKELFLERNREIIEAHRRVRTAPDS